MKQKLLNSIRLRVMMLVAVMCAAFAGQAWGDEVKVIDQNFNDGTATGWTLSGKTSYQGSAGAKSLQLASSKGEGSATTPAFATLVGTTATLTFSISSSSDNTNTLTITGNNCKVDGGTSTTASTDEGTVTITITEASTTSTITFSAAKNGGCRIDDVVVYYTSGGGPTTYTVTYNGNGATSGTAPTDSDSPYSSGATVTVLGNTGSLAKTGYSFDGWNTKSNGTGTSYSAGATFSITANTILYAKWNFVVSDGYFDFVNAASAGEDYGSDVLLSSGEYTTGNKTWTAGNVTMVTSDGGGSGIRWWSADGTLRFYNKATATFSVPSGYVITKIVTTGANFNGATAGTLSGTTWTGASNSVQLSVSDTRNIKTITVTYTTENQSVTVTGAGYATYCSPYALNYTGKGIKAYIATATSASSVTLTKVTKVPANTGIILYYDGGTTENIPVFDGKAADDVSDNLLQVSDGTVEGDALTIYALGVGKTGVNKDKVGFYLVNSGVSVPADKAYLTIGGGSVKDFLGFSFGDETGVKAIDNGQLTIDSDAVIFNLNGQRMSKMQRGINIVNGKKVLVK